MNDLWCTTKYKTCLASDAAVPHHLAPRALLEGELCVGRRLREAVVAHRRPLLLAHDVAERLALEYCRPPLHRDSDLHFVEGEKVGSITERQQLELILFVAF